MQRYELIAQLKALAEACRADKRHACEAVLHMLIASIYAQQEDVLVAILRPHAQAMLAVLDAQEANLGGSR